MSVKLRERQLSKERKRYYLDIYHEGNRSYEFLFVVEKTDNKEEKKIIANTIRSERELELISKGTAYIPKHKKKLKMIDYLSYYQKSYEKKDFRVIDAVILKFQDFMKNDTYLINDFNQNTFRGFIDYLNTPGKSQLSGDSPKSYYRRFKKIILQAHRDGYINETSFKNVIFKANTESSESTLTKEILTEDEIKLLFSVPCGNEEVKRAFLFSCYTGLGLAEIKQLTWSKIKNDRLIMHRLKTGTEINIKLSNTALELLGEKKQSKDLIFMLKLNNKFISDTAVNKAIKNWIKRADIDKKITYYCSRHSFACRLLLNGANLKSVSDALAHKSTANTIKYLNYVDSLKDNATSNLL